MAAAYPATEVGLLAQNVLSLTANQAIALDTNGWVDASDFEGYSTEDIQSWITTTARLAVNRGGVVFPSTKAKRIFALAHWVNRKILRGKPVNPNEFQPAILTEALADYPIHDMALSAKDDVDKPEQFTYEKWTDWQDSVVTFLKSKKSIKKTIPLYYVIRKEPNPILPGDMTEEDDIVYHAPHSGAAYKADNKSVHPS